MTALEEQARKNTLEGTRFNSLFKQAKLQTKGTLTATTTPTTITHDVGGIPYVRIWGEQLSGEITVPVLVSGYTSYHTRYAAAPNILFYITASSVVIYTDIGSATVYYRIYKI